MKAEPLQNLLALLRAYHWTLHTFHWQTKGPCFPAIHELFGGFYEAAQGQYDALAEKIVGNFDANTVNAVDVLRAAQPAIERWTSGGDLLGAAIAAEREILAGIAVAMSDKPSDGTANYLQGLADAHESNLYKLQQTTSTTPAPQSPAAQPSGANATMHTNDKILRAFSAKLWPIVPGKLEEIASFLEMRSAGIVLSAAEVERVAATNKARTAVRGDKNIAILPIYGTLCQKMNLMTDFSGGMSTEQIGQQFEALLADKTVDAIIFDVDSPGGEYYGTMELANRIYSARGQKPMCAIANSLAASAAYWIGSAADSFSCTPSGDVGSVGVVAVHYDQSEANKAAGVKPTYVTYGKYKAEMNSDTPLAGEALAELQKRVDDAGDQFVKAVARNRGVNVSQVKDQFGQGRCFGAGEAKSKGMIDRVETMQECMARMAVGQRPTGNRKASIERHRLDLEKLR